MSRTVDDPDDFYLLAAEQHRSLMESEILEFDLDLAFRLQLQEAIDASLVLHPSTSSSSSTPPPAEPDPLNEDVLNYSRLQSQEISKLEQELTDHKISHAEFRRIRDDLHRRIHDKKLAFEIQRMPEDEWEDCGDEFERPFGEGSSKSGSNELFRVYFKGLVEKNVANNKNSICGIGVAVCDSRDELLFELKKPVAVAESSRRCAEIKALIEGLDAALALDLSRIRIYCDYYPVFQYFTGRWSSKQQKVVRLLNEVRNLRGKFTYCQASFVARNDIKFAFKLAREAIDSQTNKSAESSNSRTLYETCVICLEDMDVSQIFSIDGCEHRYCYSCMKQHVEAKLLHGIVPRCPHENCDSELKVGSCRKFLTPKLIEMMARRIKEASIPETLKVYCPYPECSALMSTIEVYIYSEGPLGGKRKCMKCARDFCIRCKVPWHKDMTCIEYKKRYPLGSEEEVKLKNLAARNMWRQCVKCKHMIELATGCYHMTCRCGYEFCYTCGAEWKHKKATCNCPLFEYDSDEDYDEEEEEEEVEEDFDDSESDDYYF